MSNLHITIIYISTRNTKWTVRRMILHIFSPSLESYRISSLAYNPIGWLYPNDMHNSTTTTISMTMMMGFSVTYIFVRKVHKIDFAAHTLHTWKMPIYYAESLKWKGIWLECARSEHMKNEEKNSFRMCVMKRWNRCYVETNKYMGVFIFVSKNEKTAYFIRLDKRSFHQIKREYVYQRFDTERKHTSIWIYKFPWLCNDFEISSNEFIFL